MRKNVKQYKDSVPLFQRLHIEAQLDAMFSPTVTLKSGGYIVINQTEALVSIDVNSGRATREHSIEETARKTNLEAADEIARQLRLRDLAGLIVIDFIDMEDGRNDREVEKRLRDAVKNDRARVQIGKISQFGLLEMSRQRLRAGVIAGSTVTCPHCGGQGIVRSVESTALRVLRALEEEGQKTARLAPSSCKVAGDVAIYTLNQKRRELARIETEYGMVVTFDPSDEIHAGNFDIERTAQKAPEERKAIEFTDMPSAPEVEEEPENFEESGEEEIFEEASERPASAEQPREDGGHRRKRRRRRGGRDRERPPMLQEPVSPQSIAMSETPANEDVRIEAPHEPREQHTANGQPHPEGQPQGEGHRRRRRRRRGGRGRNREGFIQTEIAPPPGNGVPGNASAQDGQAQIAAPNAESAPMWSLRSEQRASQPEPAPLAAVPAPAKAPAPEIIAEPLPPAPIEPPKPATPPRKGWWQRTFQPD